jgi:TonB family protein
MPIPSHPYPSAGIAVLTAALWSCSAAAPAPAEQPSPGTPPPPPQPGLTAVGQKTPVRVSDFSPKPGTSSDKDRDVPGGGSSVPPTDEAETDEGEEIMLGNLSIADAPGSSGISTLQSDGDELKKAIQRGARARRPQLKQCVSPRLTANPRLQGRVTVTFIIDTDGKVQQAKIKSSNTGDGELDSCILAELAQLTVPPPKARVLVTYPLDVGVFDP